MEGCLGAHRLDILYLYPPIGRQFGRSTDDKLLQLAGNMNGRYMNMKYWTSMGWSSTLLGCALWTYGYFLGGSNSLVEWLAFIPYWIADYLPNWQAELGMGLALVGSIPLYYAQVREFRNLP